MGLKRKTQDRATDTRDQTAGGRTGHHGRHPRSGVQSQRTIGLRAAGTHRCAGIDYTARDTPRTCEQAPVDTRLVLIIEGHLDDLRLQHHLALDRQPNLAQILCHLTLFGWQGPHHQQPRLWISHHAATVLRTNDLNQRRAKILPEVVANRGLNSARFRGAARDPRWRGARATGQWLRDCTSHSSAARVVRYRAGGHANITAPQSLCHQIVDPEHPCLQRGRLHKNAVAVDAVFVAVHVAHGFHDFGHIDILQPYRDVTRQLRMHQHVVARATDNGEKHLPRRGVVHRQIKALLIRGCRRTTGHRRTQWRHERVLHLRRRGSQLARLRRCLCDLGSNLRIETRRRLLRLAGGQQQHHQRHQRAGQRPGQRAAIAMKGKSAADCDCVDGAHAHCVAPLDDFTAFFRTGGLTVSSAGLIRNTWIPCASRKRTTSASIDSTLASPTRSPTL